MGVTSLEKIKIHELAKDLGVSSKEIIVKAQELGLDVKNHLSSINEEDAKKISGKFNPKDAKQKKSERIKS